MNSRRPLVPLVLILTLLSLAAAPARAMGPFEFLIERLSALWAETGCTFDPNGGCANRGSAPTGCTFDPDAVCRDRAARSVFANTGCTADPDGRCRDLPQGISQDRNVARSSQE
ncbi:MAG TPA: hypothetical protein VGS22_28935 [Thermoanaerobaculia bacterium]|jgi:hypothetical protein|nr:hypothetical protein [Thermoanaerobaculia bacterium]